MNNRTEDNFKDALKTLVANEPEKLAFFDGADKAVIPPFVPRETTEDRQKVVPFKRQRRRYMFGMVAAAACCIVFVGAAMINYGPETLDSAATGGGMSAAQVAPGAPASDDYDESLRPGADAAEEDESAATEMVVAENDAGANAAFPFPLLITGAIIFAAVFLILLIKRRKLN